MIPVVPRHGEGFLIKNDIYFQCPTRPRRTARKTPGITKYPIPFVIHLGPGPLGPRPTWALGPLDSQMDLEMFVIDSQMDSEMFVIPWAVTESQNI